MNEYDERQIKKMNKIMNYHLSRYPDLQIKKALEEFKELEDEIEEYEKQWIVTDALLDELFDVDFMMQQLKEMFLDTPMNRIRYNNIVNFKIERELKRYGLV